VYRIASMIGRGTVSMLDARCSMLDARCSMLDARCSMLDARCSTREPPGVNAGGLSIG
jgi:hypothetical protein